MSINHNMIKLRRGTAAEWVSSEPQPGGEILKLGEPGYEKDTRKLKIGNGIDGWNDLDYINGGASIDIEDIQDIVGSGFLVGGTGINISYNDESDSLTISTSGVSFSGHNHTSSNISDFNSSVSGLLPVKDIVGGSGINVSSLSGTYTVAVTGVSELISEQVDDRVSQLLVEGTGVNLTYNDASGTLTIDNLHTEINVLSQEPQGFVNRTDSILSFDDSSRTFTIQPAVSGGSYSIYVEGTKIVKNTTETVVLGSGTALNYIHFDTIPPYTLHTKTTGFDFDNDVPIAFIHWNSDINQSTFFGEERHGIRMDSVTHKWIHNTFGIQYINGLSIGGYTLLGDGSSNTHAQIDISDGILYQEDIIIDIANDNGINSANEFVQELNPIAYIPTYYHSGSTGQWVRDIATAFPVKYNGTRAQYNLLSGGTWTTPNVTNDRFFAMWIVATNDINDPILAIVGQREDSSLNAAESNNNWSDINLTNIPTQEIRPLYRLIFKTNSTYTNTPKSSLQSILDIRVIIQSTSLGVVQNDHGSLFGLADDDHSQYVHIDNNRTISALHTFSNGLNSSGTLSATSGNFTSLKVNNVNVSVSGHTHSSTDITDSTSFGRNLLTAASYPAQNKLGWTIVPTNTTSLTAEIGGQYYLPRTTFTGPVGNCTINDPGSGTFGDFYTVIKNAANYNTNVNVGGINYGSSSGVYIHRYWSLDVEFPPSGSWKTRTLNDYHKHTASEITDFNSSVSGIVNNSLSTDVIAGTGISIIYDNINDDLIISSNGIVPVVSLGNLSGTNAINGGINNSIQTLSLNGSSVTFTKGSGWPAVSGISTDTVLKITASSGTPITWTIIDDWFNQPPAGALSADTHLFLLRAIGTTIEGHYIGNKTN